MTPKTCDNHKQRDKEIRRNQHISMTLGATSIEKIPKNSASGRNFLDPLPPLQKRALPTKTSVFRT